MVALTITTSHRFHYSNKKPVPISEVVNSLLAVESIARNAPAILNKLLPGVSVKGIEIYVSEISTGSIIEDFIIDLLFGGQEDYDNFRDALRKLRKGELKGLDDGEKEIMRRLMGFVMAGLIGAGSTYLVLKDNKPSTHIEAYNNTIINFGAGEFDFNGDQVKAIIEAAVDKKQLAKDVVKIIGPAKSEDGASISIDGIQDLTVSPEVVNELPSQYVELPKDEQAKEYSNAEVLIFASDRDKHAQGWAGTAPGVVDNRVKISLDKTIKPEKLHGRLKVRADITVVSRFNIAKKAYEPKEIMIRKTD